MAFQTRKRKSRTSTPFTSDPLTQPPDPKKQKTQSVLDSWVEPQVAKPTPSFEEHGFQRGGVLANMAPLGHPPTAALKKRLRGLTEGSGRRSNGGNGSGLSGGEEGISTPEMTPAPERELEVQRDGLEHPEEEDLQEVPLPVDEEDEDDDYVPSKSKGKAPAAKTPVRGKTPGQVKTPVPASTPFTNGASRSPAAGASSASHTMPAHVSGPPSTSASHNGPPAVDPVVKQRIQLAVNDAILRCNSNGRKFVGQAIRSFHADTQQDSYVHDILHAIFSQQATDEQIKYFRAYMKRTKKRLKKEEKAEKARGKQLSRSTANGSRRNSTSEDPPNGLAIVHPSSISESAQSAFPIVPRASIEEESAVLSSRPSSPSHLHNNTSHLDGDSNNSLSHNTHANTKIHSTHPFDTAPDLSVGDSNEDMPIKLRSQKVVATPPAKLARRSQAKVALDELSRRKRRNASTAVAAGTASASNGAAASSASAGNGAAPAGKSAANGAAANATASSTATATSSPSAAGNNDITAPSAAPAAAPTNPNSDTEFGSSSNGATPNVTTPNAVGDSTDSDLSDVNEDIVKNGPPEPLKKANGTAAASAAAKKAKAKAESAANARAGKKWRMQKKQMALGYAPHDGPTDEESRADNAALDARRKELEQGQRDLMDREVPTSDVRFEDEMLETESLTDSMIALGPPMGHDEPAERTRTTRRGSLHLSTLGKRQREPESAVPSPREMPSAAPSRPTTPALSQPASKKLKLTNGQGVQAARMKRSPVKNRDNPIAGVPHQGGAGARHLRQDDNDQGSPPESDDLCSACNGVGRLVCCDGCPRVFHLTCLDPPREVAPEGAFYCEGCEARVNDADDGVSSSAKPLGPLFKSLESMNARAFTLPFDVKEYYSNVQARKDGAYADQTKKIPLSKSSGYGYQGPDYLKLYDSNGKLILCSHCGNSSGGKRAILQCDYCICRFHLDCLDPPLANPPPISLANATRDAWMCPRHIDHDFRDGLLVPREQEPATRAEDATMIDAEPSVRIARKFRVPKKPTVVTAGFTRGIRNNGLIEVFNDPDDETDGEGNYVFDESRDPGNKLTRIHEKGIILDFVTHVKASRVQRSQPERKKKMQSAKLKATMEHFGSRPIAQQQAALHLMQLAQVDPSAGLSEPSVAALIMGLTSEAPNEVTEAITNGGPAPMTDEKRAQLEKLQSLIGRALGQ